MTHSGNMGVKQGLDVVLDAAALNRRDESTLFLFVGNGADCQRIQRRAADLNLHNVRFSAAARRSGFPRSCWRRAACAW